MTEEYKRQRIYIAVKGIVIDKGRALIVRRRESRTPDGGDWWEFPGGTMEFGETPEQTLVREMWEETGLDIVPERLLYVSSAQNSPAYQVIIITYLCSCHDVSKLHLSDEHSGVMWADQNEMREYLAGDIKKALDANSVWQILPL